MDTRKIRSREESPFIAGRSRLAKFDIICLDRFPSWKVTPGPKMVKGRWRQKCESPSWWVGLWRGMSE